MKIESVDFFYLAMPEIQCIGDGSQDVLLVRVCAGDHVGWGECEASPLVSIAAWCTPMSHSACQPLKASVLGEALNEPADIARIHRQVRENSLDLLQADHTLSGIDIALWDLLGKSAETPVHRLLGAKKAYPKTAYGSALFGQDAQETYRKAKSIREQGYRAAKFGWGPYGRGKLKDDADHVRAAREGLGKDTDLLVDAGTIWGSAVEPASARLDALRECKVRWLEEPFVSEAFDVYRELAKQSGNVGLAGGEGCHQALQAINMMNHAGLSYIQIDTGRIGGITAAVQVADHAEALGITFVNHTFTTPLALSASLQPYAGLERHDLCEYPVEASALADSLTKERLQPDEDGLIHLPMGPGLGLEPDLETVRKYLVETEITVAGRTLYETPLLDKPTRLAFGVWSAVGFHSTHMNRPPLKSRLLVGLIGLSILLNPVQADLIGLWSFEGDATDSSGNGHDGELNDVQFSDDSPEALQGQSLSLDGNGYIEVPHAESLDMTTAISISVFVKPGTNEWEGIIAKNPSADSNDNHAGNYELRIENGGRHLHFLHQQGGANDTAFHQGQDAVIESDVWSHVAITADTESGNVNFYVNGELIQTLEEIIAVDEFPINENPLYIGSRADLFTGFDGLMDELSLWNEVLDAERIKLLSEGPASLDDAPDADEDGIPDFYEARFAFLDPNNAGDAAADEDGDGVTNGAEFLARTDLENDDTDGDGLKDGVETNTGVFANASDTGTDPRRVDTDGDGLTDGIETNSGNFTNAEDPGTSPVNPDTDGDTFGDFVEVTLESDPLDNTKQPDGIVLAVTEESWDLATAWTDGQAPSAGKNYLVVSSVAPVIESPGSADPVFGGDRLNLIGATELLLNHSGTARIAELGIDGGILAKERSGGIGLGEAGDTLTFTQPSTIELRNPGTLTLGSALSGSSTLTVKTEGDQAFSSNAILTLESTNEGFSGDWIVENATLKGAAADSLGSGDLFLNNGILDLDYNLNQVDGVMDISGEESRIVLDQTLAFGQLTINNGAIEVPAGVYDFAGLAAVLGGGLQPIFINGGGLLVIGGDSDSDGLPDVWEESAFGNLAQTGETDTDGDDLTEAREFLFGTDPTKADSDDDGLGDKQEIDELGSDPNLADTDSDGLLDGVETNTGAFVSPSDTGTNPTKADSDGDGLSDAIENNSRNFVSAENPGTDPNKRDTDNDGAPDGQEVSVGTDPHDGNDSSLVPEGTVGLWAFEMDGPTQPDLSGNGNNVTPVGGAVWVDDPERGGVIEFNGEAYLEAPHADSLSITGDITVAAWIKAEDFSNWRGIISKGTANLPAPYDIYLITGGDGRLRFYSGNGEGSLAESTAESAPIEGEWQHIAITMEDGEVKHYLNGELNGEGSLVAEIGDAGGSLRIGNRADLVTQFAGRMDDVVLLNRAITPVEVTTLMAGGFGAPGEEPPVVGTFAIAEIRTGTGGNVRVNVVSEPNKTYAAEFSTNLIDWEITVDDVLSEGALTIIRQPLPEAKTGFIRVRVKE